MPTYAHITGRVTMPGGDVGIRARIIATPLTKNSALAFPGDRTTYGPTTVETDAAGIIQGDGLPVPLGVPGVLWRLRVVPLATYPGLAAGGWSIGDFEVTADVRFDELEATETLAVTPTFYQDVSDLAVRAEDAATAAEAVGDTNDAIMTTVADDPASTFSASLSASIADGVVEKATLRFITHGSIDVPTFTKAADNPIITQSQVALPSIYWPWVAKVEGLIDAPLGRFYMWFSTDHDGGAGGIMLAYADNLLGPWTIHASGAAIFTDPAGSQCETPSVVWNESTDLFHMYYQLAEMAGAQATQVTRLATSPDGVTWTVVGTVIDQPDQTSFPGNSAHMGYPRPWRDAGLWGMYHLLSGGDYGEMAVSYSRDGETWQIDPRPLGNSMDASGDSTRRLSWHGASVITWKGRRHILSGIQQFVSGGATVTIPWVMAPLAPDGRGLAAPLADITPAVQAWETGSVGGPACAIVEEGVIYVFYRANGAQGGFGVAVAS